MRAVHGWLTAVALSGCTADMATNDDMKGEDPTSAELGTSSVALSTAVDVSFEATPVGPLGAPWSVTASPTHASTANVVSTGDPAHGKALELAGSTTSGEFVIAALGFSASDSSVEMSYDVRPAQNAAFVFALNGSGRSLSARRIRLQRAPGSNALVAATNFGSSSCGQLASDAWTQVTLRVRTDVFPHTFDVLLNGAETACNELPTGVGTPFNGFNVMDASNEGWGGKILFDNLRALSGTSAELP